jgi:hypothetical protein
MTAPSTHATSLWQNDNEPSTGDSDDVNTTSKFYYHSFFSILMINYGLGPKNATGLKMRMIFIHSFFTGVQRDVDDVS